jgi:glycosyltransferase involved in cell wall biosynthesis
MMIYVFITTKNAEQQVVKCVQSVLDQELNEPFEVFLLDDGSEDRTVAIAEKTFGDQIKIITNSQAGGWFALLTKALDIAKNNPLIIFDTHCVAGEGWLRNMVSALDRERGISIVTNRLELGRRFMEKLTAFTMYSEFIPDEMRLIDYIHDDNFAIYPDVLRKLLNELPVNKNLNDGVASVLLSSKIKKLSLHVLYEPSIQVLHISPTFLGYLSVWYGFMAKNTIKLRRLDPSIRGSGYLKLGVLAPFIYSSARFAQDIKNVFKLRKTLHINPFEIPLLVILASAGKASYLFGMIKVILRDKKIL